MKKLTIILLTLFMLGGAKYTSDINYESSGAATVSTGPASYYVETTGNDENSCTSVADACATFQGAIDKLPDTIRHETSITAGTGTFAGFTVQGKNIEVVDGSTSTLTIEGTMSLATGVSTYTGNIDANPTLREHLQITCNAANWTPGECDGMYVKAGTAYFPIIECSGTTLDYNGISMAGTFEIWEPTTIIAGAGMLTYGNVEIVNNTASAHTILWVQYLKTTDSQAMGFMAYDSPATFFNCTVNGKYWGFFLAESTRLNLVARTSCMGASIACYKFAGAGGIGGVEGATVEYAFADLRGTLADLGFEIVATNESSISQVVVWGDDEVGQAGISYCGPGIVQVDSSEFYNLENGINANGYKVDEICSGGAIHVGDSTLESNTESGIKLDHGASVYVEDANVVGTNTEWGVEAWNGSVIYTGGFASGLTGGSGNFTVDGTTAGTWANLNANHPYIDLNGGTRAADVGGDIAPPVYTTDLWGDFNIGNNGTDSNSYKLQLKGNTSDTILYGGIYIDYANEETRIAAPSTSDGSFTDVLGFNPDYLILLDQGTDVDSPCLNFQADEGGTVMVGGLCTKVDPDGYGPTLVLSTPNQTGGDVTDVLYLVYDSGGPASYLFPSDSLDGVISLGNETGNQFKNVNISGDYNGAGGFAMQLDYWYEDNVAASQTDAVLDMDGNTSRTEVPTVRAGSVIGVCVYSNEARTAGTLTVDPTINGTKTGLTAVLDVTNTQTKCSTQAKDTDTFTAGQRIGVKLTTDGAWAPATADITVSVLIEQ